MHSALLLLFLAFSGAGALHESNVNLLLGAGRRACFYVAGRAAQTLETQYRVVGGGGAVSFGVLAPGGAPLHRDRRRDQNSVILELSEDGDYGFCAESELPAGAAGGDARVYVYVLLEGARAGAARVTVAGARGPRQEARVLEWRGEDDDGSPYYLELGDIEASLARTLRRVARARALLDAAGAAAARDGGRAARRARVVDAWSAGQIALTAAVGALQVYTIRKLFRGGEESRGFY